MKVKDIMTRAVVNVSAGATLEEAAERMRNDDIGFLIVREGDQAAGTLTDRDITVRATALGLDPKETLVNQIMTPGVTIAYEDEDVSLAAHTMEQGHIRRLMVVNSNDEAVGIVSLGNLAVAAHNATLAGQVVEEVSKPAPGT
jgi:CBS domain-containing protein